MKALEGVEDWREVANGLGTYCGSSSSFSIIYSLRDAVEWFLQGRGFYQPSWRAVIFALDGTEETPIVNRIRNYGEPVQGRYAYTHPSKMNTTGAKPSALSDL